MIPRPTYLDKIKKFIDLPVVKVLTGIRRSGKSTVLKLLAQELKNRDINERNIIYINLEMLSNENLLKEGELYKYISSQVNKKEKFYVLIDEIQEASKWERVINSLMAEFDLDLYITGSNSRLLSSELSTYLAGRYVEINIFTLSYLEFIDFKKHYSTLTDTNPKSSRELFIEYSQKGGFPIVHLAEHSLDTCFKLVQDIYSSVILRDTIQRHNIRDTELLNRVVNYVFDNVGNTFSAQNIADYFKSQQRSISLNTIYEYLNALEGAFIIYRCKRYNLKGKEILKTQEKFYLADISLLYSMLGFRPTYISGVLENIVYLELRRRGYDVFVGKLNSMEIDFIATQNNMKLYIQVAYKVESPETVEREFKPLLAVKDNYPKFVISTDEANLGNHEGIEHKNIVDFLMQGAQI